MKKAPKPEWTVDIKDHCVDQWRTRYGDSLLPSQLTDEEIRQTIRRRILIGFGSLKKWTRAQVKALRKPHLLRTHEDQMVLSRCDHSDHYDHGRMIVGDLTFVYFRYGIEIHIITIVFNGGYTDDTSEPHDIAHAKRLERQANNNGNH
jgi:hypothetical protein